MFATKDHFHMKGFLYGSISIDQKMLALLLYLYGNGVLPQFSNKMVPQNPAARKDQTVKMKDQTAKMEDWMFNGRTMMSNFFCRLLVADKLQSNWIIRLCCNVSFKLRWSTIFAPAQSFKECAVSTCL